MNTLLKGVLFFIGAVIFVNILLFDILKMSRESIPFGTLFLIQISVTVFILFVYFIAIKKS